MQAEILVLCALIDFGKFIILPRLLYLKREGDSECRAGPHLELTERSIRPRVKSIFSHNILDEHKRKLAAAVVSLFTPKLIRAHSLANLHRWRENGVWVSAYEEWKEIMGNANDGELFAVMLGRDEYANRMRQSPPYVGFLPRDQVKKLNEEAAG